MRPGAELRIATDIPAYARTVLEAAIPHAAFRWTATCPSDWRTPWPDWPGTRYEAKAHREGRRPMFLTFHRV
jgi:tRNA (guanine-N7-)-methyltransferase